MKSVMSTYSSAGILAVLAFTAIAAGRAQEPRRLISADSIPRDLAAALIASGGFGALCSDQQVLAASAARQRGTVTNITYRISTTGGYSVCRPPKLPVGPTRSAFPTLYNPPAALDARMSGDCANNFNGSGTSTTLRTSMSADALLDHYARQLQDSGWTSAGEKASIVGRTWSRTDSAGTPVDVVITVTTPAQNSACRELNLQVRTMQKP